MNPAAFGNRLSLAVHHIRTMNNAKPEQVLVFAGPRVYEYLKGFVTESKGQIRLKVGRDKAEQLYVAECLCHRDDAATYCCGDEVQIVLKAKKAIFEGV